MGVDGLPVRIAFTPRMPPTHSAESPGHGLARWFAEEVQPHEPALRAYLRARFPAVGDHDDLVQETYARLLRAREQGRLTYAKAFLFTAARNVAIDVFRRRQTTLLEPLPASEEMPLLTEVDGTVEALERQQRLHGLLEAIDALPERCRQVIMLRHLDGLPYKEIAVRLGISPETVKVHMVRGVRSCTEHFRARGLLDDSAEVVAMERGSER